MNPLDHVIYKSWDYHKKLSRHMDKSNRHVQVFRKFLDGIRNANEEYGKILHQCSEKFYQDISKEIIENEALLCCYDYLFHFISIISQHHKNTAMNIQNKLIDPFNHFVENLKATNKNLLKGGQALIENLENSKSELLKKQQKYYFKSQEAENYTQTISTAPDLEKSFEINYRSYENLNKQASVEKTCEEYKNTINTVNKKWESHGSQFFSIFENFDLNEESRFHFIKLNVSQVISNIEEAYKNVSAGVIQNMNSQVPNQRNFESKVKQIEENIAQKKFGLALEVKKSLGSRKDIKKEEFVSFETWKKLYGENTNLKANDR